MQNKKYKIQNTKYRIGNTDYKLKRASVAKKKVRRCSVEVARSRSEHCSSPFFEDSLDFSSESFQIEGSLTFLDLYNFFRCKRDSSDKSKYHLFINHPMCGGGAILFV